MRIDGRSYDELHAALGGVLVDKLLDQTPPSIPSPTPKPKKSKKSVPLDAGNAGKKTRTPSRWNHFCKAEKLKVRGGMPHLKGHDVLVEIARRWKIQKAVDAGNAPLMLSETSSSSSDREDVTELAKELIATSTTEDMKANMQAAGLDIDSDAEVNASRLAMHMVHLT